MKKYMKFSVGFITLALLLSFCSFTLSSCSTKDEIILNVYNWGEYISDGEDETLNVNAEFEKYFNEKLSQKYGHNIKVNYTTYSSNEELYAKLKNTNTSYDVIIPSDYLISLLIRENMLHKLDFNNIPNFEYIDQAYIDGNYYDPTNEFSVPYTMGKVGIIYNTEKITDEIDSWDALWNESYKDAGILQFNNSRDAFAVAQFKLGISINTKDPLEWEKAHEELMKQKPLIQKYVMDEVFNKMESGNASIAPYYAGDYFTMYASNENLAFVYPKEGSNSFIDAMCIPTCSKNKELAELYINFMLEPEVARANAEYICYASPHTAVSSDPEYIEYMTNEVHPDAIDILYNDFEKDFKNEGFVALDDDVQKHANELWDELKIAITPQPFVYVLSGAIVAALIFAIIFFTIRKKIRENTY